MRTALPPRAEKEVETMSYLRMTIGRWTIDLTSAEAGEIFRQIQEEGVSVFHKQPGFVRYRLMRADAHTTIAVAEWESEQLGAAGAQRFRDWLKSSGIAAKLTLETYAGEVVAAS
jgi:heme-degrading monooxygenase HmoA